MLSPMFSTMTRRRWFLVLLLFVGAIALSSCNPAKFKTQAAQVPQLVDHIVGEPKTFNFALSNEVPNIFGPIYDGLITESGDTGQLQPALAESWEISKDKQRIIFTLRKGLKWSDGEPLTVDDVVFSFNDIYFNEQIPTAVTDGLRIGKSRALPKVSKLDDRRVEFAVPEPFAPLLRSAGETAILPKHALYESVVSKDRDGKPLFLSTWGTDTDPQKIISSGPYKLGSYAATQRVIFQRNPYYWRRDAQGNPQPYIERVVWETIENSDTALLQFRSGGLDTLAVGSRSFRLLKREEKRGKFSIYNGGPDTGTSFISFNLNKGSRNGRPLVDPVKSRWFNTLEFRQAVAYGIDRRTMIDNIFQGLGAPQDSPIPVQSPYYLSPKAGLKTYEYNPQKARELLQKAGFKYNNGQLLDADDNRVRFTLNTNTGSPTADAIGSQIKRDLSKIGIQVDYQPITFNVLLDKLSNSLDSECIFLGFTGGVEPNNGANVWFSDGASHQFNQKPKPGTLPIQGREVADWEKKIDQLFIDGARELDEAKRKAIYAEFQRTAQEYLPFIHLVNPLDLLAVRDRIQNVKYSALGDPGSPWNFYELKAVEQ